MVTSTTDASLQAVQFSFDTFDRLTLPTMNPITQSCTGNTSADLPYRVPITFRQNIDTGCVLSYTLGDLTNNCANIRRAIWNMQLGPIHKMTHLGRWGNSSWSNLNGWVKILKDIPDQLVNPTVGPSLDRTCVSLLTELSIYVFYTDLRSQSNPQSSIVGAKFIYQPGAFSYKCSTPAACQNTAKPQNFMIKSSVKWIKITDTDLKEYIPPPPPLLPKIPADVFYPFVMLNSAMGGVGHRDGMWRSWVGMISWVVGWIMMVG